MTAIVGYRIGVSQLLSALSGACHVRSYLFLMAVLGCRYYFRFYMLQQRHGHVREVKGQALAVTLGLNQTLWGPGAPRPWD